jgi:hypothetical protein
MRDDTSKFMNRVTSWQRFPLSKVEARPAVRGYPSLQPLTAGFGVRKEMFSEP